MTSSSSGLGGEIKQAQGVANVLGNAKQVYAAIAGLGQGTPAAVAFAGAAGLLVAAGGGIAYEIKSHHDKAIVAEANALQKLKKQIMPYGPDIFQADKNGTIDVVKFVELPDGLVRDLATTQAMATDGFLIEFGHPISNAQSQITGYMNEAGLSVIARNFLVWLEIVISDHLSKYQGVEADMKILEDVTALMRAFAGTPKVHMGINFDVHNRRRFGRLIAPINELDKAHKLLGDHENSRNLKEFVDQLMSDCYRDFIPNLSKLITKSITPPSEWKRVDSMTPEMMAAGNIREAHSVSESRLKRAFHISDKSVNIPDSFFKTWLQRASTNVLNFQTSDQALSISRKDLPAVKAFMKICPNFLTLKAPQRNDKGGYDSERYVPVGYDESCFVTYADTMTEVDKPGYKYEPDSFLIVNDNNKVRLFEVDRNSQRKELIYTSDQANYDNRLEAFRAVLSPAKKAALTWVKSKEKDAKKAANKALTEYRNNVQLETRANVFRDQALVQDQLTDLEIFSKQLDKVISDLGEVYMRFPQHCNYIFDIYQFLGTNIKSRVNRLLKSFDLIDEQQIFKTDMLYGDKADMRSDLIAKLKDVRHRVSKEVDGALAMHGNHVGRWGDPHATGEINPSVYDQLDKLQSVKAILATADKIAKKYNFKIKNNYAAAESKDEEKEVEISQSGLRSVIGFGHEHDGQPSVSTVATTVNHSLSSQPAPSHPLSTQPLPLSTTHHDSNVASHPAPAKSDEEDGIPDLPNFVGDTNPPHTGQPVPIHQPPPVDEHKGHNATPPPPSPRPQENKEGSENKEPDNEAVENIAALLAKIKARIPEISTRKEDPKRAVRQAFDKISLGLSQLDTKSKDMKKASSPERKEKGEQLQALGIAICKKTLEYINQDLAGRRNSAHTFHDSVTTDYNNADYLVDEHRSTVGLILRGLKQLAMCFVLGYGIYDGIKNGFTTTASRQIGNDIQGATKDLEAEMRRQSQPARSA